MNLAVQEWCAVLVSDKTPIVLHIINTITILNELQHVVVILIYSIFIKKTSITICFHGCGRGYMMRFHFRSHMSIFYHLYGPSKYNIHNVITCITHDDYSNIDVITVQSAGVWNQDNVSAWSDTFTERLLLLRTSIIQSV
jgi:hypothetical protein